MEQEFIERMKEKLLSEREIVAHALEDQNAEFKKIIEGGEKGDEADIASDVVDGMLLQSRGKQDLNRLQMINNALDRIKQGKYGVCLMCKKEIPQARLELIPYAFLCLDCKSRDERRNR